MGKDALGKQYPGLDFSLFTKELDELREENKFLRFSVNSERLELVDSNLRKKKRIKDMQKEIEELRSHISVTGAVLPFVSSASSVTWGSSGGNAVTFSNDKKQTTSSVEELEMELSTRDDIITRLKEQNESLQSKTNLYKVQLDKSKVEEELRKQNQEANSVLEGELRALRNMVKELGSRSGLHGKLSEMSEGVSEEMSRKLKDHLQTQSTNHDGFSTLDTLDSIEDSKPSELRDELNSAYDKLESFKIKEKQHVSKENLHKEKIRTLKDKVNSLKEENISLSVKLDSTKADLSELQVQYDSLEEKSSKNEQRSNNSSSSEKEKIRALNEENISLIQQLDNSKNETISAQKEILKLRTDMGVMRTEKEKAIEEAKKLMASMKYKEKEEKEDDEELS